MERGKSDWQNLHQDLIDKCRKGDKQAQFEIYRLYYKSMYNVSLRIVNETQEAEDIMQDSFLSAFENIGSYRGKVSFGAWLRRIVINRSIDALKKRKNLLTGIEEVEDMPDLSDSGNSDYEETRLEVERIQKCISLLPDGYRIILSLYLLEGYDHEEIALILGISASTSRSQYTRARHKLAVLLKKDRRDG